MRSVPTLLGANLVRPAAWFSHLFAANDRNPPWQ